MQLAGFDGVCYRASGDERVGVIICLLTGVADEWGVRADEQKYHKWLKSGAGLADKLVLS